MTALLLVLPLPFLLGVAALGVRLFARLRASRHAAHARADLERRAAGQAGDAVVLRGVLRVDGDGCDGGFLPLGAKIAAHSGLVSRSRLWPRHTIGSGNHERAARLTLLCGDTEVRLEGPVAVASGMLTRWLGSAIRDVNGLWFDAVTAVYDGDAVIALGQRRDAPVSDRSGQAGYRRADTCVLLRAAAGGGRDPARRARLPRVILRGAGAWRHPWMFASGLVALALGVGLAAKYDKAVQRCERQCTSIGACDVRPRLWAAPGEALRDPGGDLFVCVTMSDNDCHRASQCRYLGACSVVDGACRAVRDDDCSHTTYCRESGQCHAEGGECVARGDDCRGTSGCEDLGRCTAKGGACHVGGDADCAQSYYCREIGNCSAVGDDCKARKDADCEGYDGCASLHRCTARDGECVIGKDDDCRRSDACTEYGKCSAVNGECVAASDDDCRGARVCKRDGLCSAREDRCVAVEDAGCAASEECAKRGACAAQWGHCVATSEAHCRASAGCRERGLCSVVDGACVAAKDEDCAPIRLCRRLGYCTAQDGACKRSAGGRPVRA